MTSQRAGFSLFEVLISFAILALVLTALIPGQAQLLGRADESDQRALALEYAFSRSAALSIVEPLRIGQRRDQYRDWAVTETTSLVEQSETGQFVETRISILDARGRSLAELAALGFIPDAP